MFYLILCVFAVGWFLAAYLGYRIGECPLPPVAKVVTPEIPWLGPARDLASEIKAMRASLAAERVASEKGLAHATKEAEFFGECALAVRDGFLSIASERDGQAQSARLAQAAIEKLHGGLEGLQLLLAQSAARVGEAQASRRGAAKEKRGEPMTGRPSSPRRSGARSFWSMAGL